MKKFLPASTGILLVIMIASVLQGCFKDTYTRTQTYTYYAPVYKTTAEVRANIKSGPARTIGQPGKLYIKDQYIFLNDVDKGIHIIDNSNPSSPQNIAFIDIPGNMDLAVKGNTLYADLYTDLVALDITNPQNIVLKKIVEGVFPTRYYDYFRPDSTKIIASWQKRDTVITDNGAVSDWVRRGDVFIMFSALNDASVGVKNNSGGASVAPYGMGGSMARFAITNERLYTVGRYDLDVFNINNPVDPVNITRKNVGMNIETIFPFKNNLFIGSQSGMYIYNISNPDNPVQQGQFNHVRSCDPVIADDQYAYVTLRSGTACQGFTNQMDVVNIANFNNPQLVRTYQLTNPHGLSKDGNTLFICDGKDGLKIYNAENALQIEMIKHITNIETYDVIAWNGNALVVAEDGLYQYDYSNLSDIRLKSKITVTRE